MKAATGELNLTLITVVALGALLALFTGFLWPRIQEKITGTWDDTNDSTIDVDQYEGAGYKFDEYIESELF